MRLCPRLHMALVLTAAGVASLLLLGLRWGAPYLISAVLSPERDSRRAAPPVVLDVVPAPPVPGPLPARAVADTRQTAGRVPLTDEELDIKRRIEDAMHSEMPTHRVTLNDGRTMSGRVEQDTGDYLMYSESYRGTGALSIRIPKDRVQGVDDLTLRAPPVTRRDVRFKMEFPGMNLYKRGPYTVVTDENYFHVEHTVEMLVRLFDEIRNRFGPILGGTDRDVNMQILVFRKDQDFIQYRDRHAAAMSWAIGFYSPELDRLVMSNQADSERFLQSASRLEAEARRHRESARTVEQWNHVGRWERDNRNRLMAQAKSLNMSILRHEGAHQIFFDFHVHAPTLPRHEWVVEGLATYCETDSVGLLNDTRIGDLRALAGANRLRPLKDVLPALPVNAGQYSECWSLTHLLMQPRYQPAFFRYLAFIGNQTHRPPMNSEAPDALLCRFLNTSPDALEKDWRYHVSILIREHGNP